MTYEEWGPLCTECMVYACEACGWCACQEGPPCEVCS